MDYLTLTMGEAATATEEIAAEALNVFGSLDQRQMNWKPAPERRTRR